MILEALIPALLPVATDGVRAIFNRITGFAGAKPANVDEVIQLMDAETGRLEALSKIDSAGNVSQWVSNIRALQRPAASLLIISAYIGSIGLNAETEVINSIGTYAQMVTFYLFGDRTYMYMKKAK